MKVNKPRKGDKVSLSFSFMGLTSYELYTIDRVRAGKVWIDAHDAAFDSVTGRYSADDMGASRWLLFDGGKAAEEYQE